MRFNFRKISAIGASILMTGLTLGTAVAANYPAPFVSGGSADVAVVYGTGVGVASSDFVQASNIIEDLQAELGGSSSIASSSVTGGDSVLLERSSDKLNLNNNANAVFVTSVDDDDLPTLLADGTYIDDTNTEYDYTQKVTLSTNLGVEHFADSDFNDEEPTIGLKLSDDEHVLNYTIDFSTHPAYNATTMETTTLTLMGREYYVLDVKGMGDASTDNKTTLLDSANSGIVIEDETLTLEGKSVYITYIATSEVKLSVDGETTNSLEEGETFKLTDGTYVGIKDIMYDAKDTGISSVEISIGTGKLELIDGSDIELNDETVNGIQAFMTQDSSFKLDKIVLQWKVDDESFIAQDNDLLMPGFEALKFSFGGFVVPEAEETEVKASASDVMRLSTYIEDGAVDIDLLGANSTGGFDTVGKDTSNRLVTTADPTYLFFNETAGDKYIVASWNSTTEAESYYLEVDTIEESSVNKVRFQNKVTDEITKVANGSDASFGSVALTVVNLTKDGSKKWVNLSINDGGSFHELYTAGGLKVYLPYYTITAGEAGKGSLNYTNATAPYIDTPWVQQGIYNGTLQSTDGHGGESFYLWFHEEDKDGNLGNAGITFNVTLDESGTSNKVHVSAVGIATSSSYEIGDTDVFEEYVLSDLATKTLYDTGGDVDSVKIIYAGEQSYAELYLTAPEATVTSTVVGGEDSLGEYLIKDSEVSSMSSMNLVVVGGSCINSAAAALVGEAACGPKFTELTGVGTGEFLIKGYASSSISDKIALLVAGYEMTDTANAATYLRTSTVDTSKEYKGTSSTSAELVMS